MKPKALLIVLSFVVVALLLGGCAALGGEDTSDVGTAERPIKVLFVPSVDVDFIIDNADIVVQAFEDATGLVFEGSVPTSYAATIEEICASPADTIAFLPALAYTLASDYCGVEPGIAAARDGRAVYWSAFIVARDSEFETVEDLEGASWGFPYPGSSSGFLFPSAALTKAGVTPGEQVETGGHTNTVLAVANGSVDFGTVYFSPPQYPTSGKRWEFGDEIDVPDELVDSCAMNADEELACGDDFIVNDARASATDDFPNIVQLVRVLALTDDIPNDTLSFGPKFPDDLKQKVIDGVISYVGTDACYETLCAEKFYEWDEAAPIGDESFDLVRIIRDDQGITIDTIDEEE
jgi:phosphonate transport system substrate-binding protein